jgi:hypothetical protein
VKKYHKIQTVYKRDPNRRKRVLEGMWAEEEFHALALCKWTWTEKLDGMNIRVIWNHGKLEFRGKTDNAQIPPALLQWLQANFDRHAMENCFKESNEVCLYGEGVGPRIQGGSMYGTDQHFVLFDVRIGDWWLTRKSVCDISVSMQIPLVPIVGMGDLLRMTEFVKGRPDSRYGDGLMEGVVARPIGDLRARNGSRIITKLKVCDFETEEQR